MSEQNPETTSSDHVDVHDRAMPDGGPAIAGPPASTTQPRWDANSQSRTGALPVAAGAGALGVLVTWILWRLRVRRRPPTPSERLAGATRAVGAASARLGDRAGDRLGEVAGYVGKRAPGVASHAAEIAGEVAAQAATAATEVGGRTVQAAQRAGGGLADAAATIADNAEQVYGTTTKWLNRLLLALVASFGYVLGARAGRQRYDQLAGLAGRVARRPEIQIARDKAEEALSERTGLGGGGAGKHSGDPA